MALGFERKWLLVGVVAAVVNPTLNLAAIPFAQFGMGNGSIAAAAVTVVTEADGHPPRCRPMAANPRPSRRQLRPSTQTPPTPASTELPPLPA